MHEAEKQATSVPLCFAKQSQLLLTVPFGLGLRLPSKPRTGLNRASGSCWQNEPKNNFQTLKS